MSETGCGSKSREIVLAAVSDRALQRLSKEGVCSLLLYFLSLLLSLSEAAASK